MRYSSPGIFQWNILHLDASQLGSQHRALPVGSSAYEIYFQKLRVREVYNDSFYFWKSLFPKRQMHSGLFYDSRFASIYEYIVMHRTLIMLVLEIQIYLFLFNLYLLHPKAFVSLYIVNLLLPFYLSLLLFPFLIILIFIHHLHYFFLELKIFLC